MRFYVFVYLSASEEGDPVLELSDLQVVYPFVSGVRSVENVFLILGARGYSVLDDVGDSPKSL